MEKNRVGGTCRAYGKRCINVLQGKYEEKGLFGRRRYRWKDDIKMDLQEV
jgi:hypothetical protein